MTGTEVFDFRGATRFGAYAPALFIYNHICALVNGWRFRQVLLGGPSAFLPALVSPFGIALCYRNSTSCGSLKTSKHTYSSYSMVWFICNQGPLIMIKI